ncbi:MAG: glycosyltransferase family 25 protein [Pseudomonadota bacterium]
MDLDTHLINLDRAEERLASATKQLDQLGMTFQRFSAVDGSKLSDEETRDYSEHQSFQRMGRSMSPGEIGCFLSHYRVAKAFLKSDHQYCLALEDDLLAAEDLPELLESLVGYLETKHTRPWYLVNLGNAPTKLYSRLTTIETHTQNYDLVAAHHFPVLTTALLWSREGAEAFVKAGMPMHAPVDQFLKDWCTRNRKGQGLAFLQPPVKTIGAESQISYDETLGKARRGMRNGLYFLRKQRRHILNNYMSVAGKLSYKR